MSAGAVGLSLFSSVLLKIYLDIFLHQAARSRQLMGWWLFFAWQYFSELNLFSERGTLVYTFAAMIFVGMISYTGSWWKRCMFPIVYLAIWMLLEGVSVLGVGLISGGTEAGFYVSSAISKVLLLLFTMGLWMFVRIMGIGKEPYSGSAIFLLLPVSGMGLYHLLYLLLYRVKDGRMDNWWGMLLIAMILLVLNISFYPIYLKMIQVGYIKTREYFYKEQIELFR